MTNNPRKNPYVGPRAFETGEKLHGRDTELNELSDLLVAERIVLLYSPSGAGKSSLVRAGLVPRLRDENFLVLPVARVNLEPPDNVREHKGFNRYIFSVLSSFEDGMLEEKKLLEAQRLGSDKLAQLQLAEYLQGLQKRLQASRGAKDEPLSDLVVLIFDQFEEVITNNPTDRDGKLEFFNQLGKALRDRRYWALFAMREDYIATLDPYQRPVPTRFANTFRLDLLGLDSALDAIKNPPFEEHQVTFDKDAAKALVKDLSRVQVQTTEGDLKIQEGLYVEPVQLQVVCFRLWEGLDENDKLIGSDDIAKVGDVDRSLREYYAERVAEVAEKRAVSERRIRKWFNEKLITESGIRSQVLMGAEVSDGLDTKVVRALEDVHLVRAEKRRNVTWFELAHDRLLAPVKTDNEAWFLEHLSVLQRQAALWEKENRPGHLLLHGQAFMDAEKWLEGYAGRLEIFEEEYLKACRQARSDEEEQKKQQAKLMKLEEQARVATQLRRRLVWALSAAAAAGILAIATLFSGYRAIQASEIARQNAVTANAASTLAVGNAAIAQANAEEAYQNAAAAQTAQAQALEQKNLADVALVTAEAARQLAAQNAQEALENAQQAQANFEAAQYQQQLATSRQLAAQAASYLRDDRRELAALLAVEAWAANDTSEARSVLFSSLQRSLAQTFVHYGAQIPSGRSDLFSVAISQSGERLAWGSADGFITLWDYSRQERIDVWDAHETAILSLAFSPDGRWLASGGRDGRLFIWDLQAADIGRSYRQLVGATNIVFSVAFNKEGTLLAAAYGSRAGIWDMTQAGRPNLRNIPQQSDSVSEVAWSPDGKLLATAGFDRRVQVWNAETMELKYSHRRHLDVVYTLDFSADGRLVASAGEDRRVIFWDYAADTFPAEPINTNNNKFIYTVAFSADNRILAVGGEDFSIALVDTQTFKIVGRLDNYHVNTVRSLAFRKTPGINLLASASLDDSVGLHEIRLQQPLSEAVLSLGERVMVQALAPGEGEQILAAARQDGNLRLFAGLGSTTTLEYSLSNAPTRLALSRDGRWLAVGERNMLRIIDLQAERQVASFQAGIGELRALAFSWDSTQLASILCSESVTSEDEPLCIRHELSIWDVTTQAFLANLSVDESALAMQQQAGIYGHTAAVNAIAFSPDGGFVATAGKDNQVIQWNLTTGLPRGVPLQVNQPVVSLTYSPNGGLLAAGLQDNSLQLWQAESGQPLGEPLLGANGPVDALLFLSEESLLSSTGGGQVLRWDIAPSSWAQRACVDIAKRNLTQAEFVQFFPGQTYRKTCDAFPEGQ